MENKTKNYIGKGKKVEGFNMVNVVLTMEEAEKFTFEYNGKKYLKFTLSERKEVDNYGNTHNAFVVPKPEPAAEPTKGKKAAAKK